MKLPTKQNNFSLPDIIKNQFPKNNQLIFISNKNDLTISKFTTLEEDSIILDLLMKWKIYSGISNQPSAADYNLILDFVKLQYPTLNLFDIDNCINLITSNKLIIKKGSSDESFSNFSCTFVGRCLTAYLHYKKEIVYDIKQELLKHQQSLPPPKKTIEERLIEKKEFIRWSYKQIKKEQYKFDDFKGLLFDFLYYNKFVVITEVKKNEALLYARTKLSNPIVNQNTSSFQKAISGLEILNNKAASKYKTNNNYSNNDLMKESANYIVIKYFLELENIDNFINKITKSHVETSDLK